MKPYDLALSALRSRPVTGTARWLTRGKLRVLAYHGVDDAESFAAQMDYVAANFKPVDETAVAAALTDGASLPDGAAWVTFDDGDPTVVRHGLPVLERLGIPATMFVCPGLIETNEPFWWRITDWAGAQYPHRAEAHGGGPGLTEYVKTVADGDRRAIVAEFSEDLYASLLEQWRQLSLDELERWRAAGMFVGNHTWDHPCLDRCTEQDQRAQVTRAHQWLSDFLGEPPASFAYPNGNFAPVVDAQLRDLDYRIGVLYDNQLTGVGAAPLRLSRLMLESNDPVDRLAGVLSGAQPTLARLTRRG